VFDETQDLMRVSMALLDKNVDWLVLPPLSFQFYQNHRHEHLEPPAIGGPVLASESLTRRAEVVGLVNHG
jgi:hypothetical protein